MLIEAKAHMSLSRATNGFWLPWYKRIQDARKNLIEVKHTIPGMSEDLVRAAKLMGYSLVSDRDLEQLEAELVIPVTGGAEMSNYLETEIMEFLFAETAIFATPAGTSYVSLYTTDPTDADSGTEVSGGSYARELVESDGASTPRWTAPSGGAVENAQAVTFTTATGSWGTVSHAAIHDAVTAGNLWFHSALDSSKVVDTDDVFQFAAGDLDVSVA